MYFTLIKNDKPDKLIWTSTAAIEKINETRIGEKIDSLIPKTNNESFCNPCCYGFVYYNDILKKFIEI
jgi:hypothetical protein